VGPVQPVRPARPLETDAEEGVGISELTLGARCHPEAEPPTAITQTAAPDERAAPGHLSNVPGQHS